MPESEVDLISLFNSVTRTLKANKESLNNSDEYNHNHGDNMVNNFKVITKALREKRGQPPAEQLTYAGQVLSRSSTTGSANLYANGLSEAAKQLKGQPAVTPQNAMSMIQALMGGQSETQPSHVTSPGLIESLMGGQTDGQPSQSAPTNMIGQLLGSFLGGDSNQPTAVQPAESQSPDTLSGLLGSLLGGSSTGAPHQTPSTNQAGSGIDLNTLMTAGAAFMQANQQGASTMEAIIQAVMAGSQMNSTPHHSQSGQLVASTLINSISSMLTGKK